MSGIVLLSALLTAGCAARFMRIEEKGVTCAEAHQIAITAVQKMGYTISEATKPAPGTPGLVTGTRQEGTEKHSVLVQVFCTSLGSAIEAKTDEGTLAQLSFPSAFRRSVEAAVAARPPERKAAEEGVDVLMTPEHGNLGVGANLVDLGILPMTIRITDRTTRAYHFRVRDVGLQTADGEHVKPVALSTIAGKLDAATAAALQEKLLGDRDIAPNESVTGVLLFPFKAYARARVVLQDRESGEPEGFSIEF